MGIKTVQSQGTEVTFLYHTNGDRTVVAKQKGTEAETAFMAPAKRAKKKGSSIPQMPTTGDTDSSDYEGEEGLLAWVKAMQSEEGDE